MFRRQDHEQTLNMEDLGHNLMIARQSRQLSKTYVASQVNISPNSIYYYESGKSAPSLDTFLSLLNLYHLSADKALGRSEYTALQLENVKDLVDLCLFLRENLGAKIEWDQSANSNNVSVSFTYNSASLRQFFALEELSQKNSDSDLRTLIYSASRSNLENERFTIK